MKTDNNSFKIRRGTQMKTSKILFRAATVLLLLRIMPESSLGQIYLTGLLQDGTSANGQTAGSPIWNTLGNELSFANLYVTQPNAGYNAHFINSGNGAGASIDYALSPGSYQFYFFCDSFSNNNPGYYGLSLFFDGNNNASPGIAAYSAAGVSSANAVPAGFNTFPLSGSTSDPAPAPGTYIYTATPIPVPGSLTYTADGLTVTLTGYGFGTPGSFGVPALDRVGDLNDSPDGDPDGIGVFTLTVVPVPESSTGYIVGLGLVSLLAFRRGCQTFGKNVLCHLT